MNPYTYKSRKSHEAAVQPLNQKSWFSEIVNAQISSFIAVAFVLFAAGSVAAMTASAYPEISSAQEPGALPITHSQQNRSEVLGASVTAPIIDDSALEAGDPSGSISAKPVSFDSTAGRWDYNINYLVSSLNGGTVTLTIGTYVVQSGITAPGTVETGAILKPSMAYNLSLWLLDSAGDKQSLAHLLLKTPKGKTTAASPTSPFCVQPANLNLSSPAPSSTPSTAPSLCIKEDNGTVSCMGHIMCMGGQQPGYPGGASSTPGFLPPMGNPPNSNSSSSPQNPPPPPPQNH